MARVLAILLLVAVSSVVSFVIGARRSAKRPPADERLQETGAQAATGVVNALGKLMPMDGIVNVSALPGDEVDKVLVAEGQPVAADDPLVVLKSREIRSLERDLAAQRLKEAKQQLEVEQLVADSRLEAAKLSAAEARLKAQDIQRQAALLELLRRQAEQAQRDLDRLESLAADPVTREVASSGDLEKQKLLVDKLTVDVEQAVLLLAATRESQQLALQVADSQVKSAQLSADSVTKASPLGSLQRALELATQQWEMTEVRSPSDGRVLRLLINPGERVTNMPLLQIGDVSRMACLAEVYESNLSSIKTGQAATLSSSALQRPLKGTVRRVGQMIGRPSLPNPDPLSRQDVRTGEVLIELDAPSARVAAELVNLQVSVVIDTQGAGKPEADDQAAGGVFPGAASRSAASGSRSRETLDEPQCWCRGAESPAAERRKHAVTTARA